jgi:hypothetical protein
LACVTDKSRFQFLTDVDEFEYVVSVNIARKVRFHGTFARLQLVELMDWMKPAVTGDVLHDSVLSAAPGLHLGEPLAVQTISLQFVWWQFICKSFFVEI